MATLEGIFDKAVAEGKIPGAVILARDRSGRFNFARAFGKQALSEGAGDIQLNTVFQLASMTKLMTSIAALQVVERGLVKLDDDVSHLIPVLAEQPILTGFNDDGKPHFSARKNPLKLRYLLTHSAGAGYEALEPKLIKWRKDQGHEPSTSSTFSERFAYPLTYEPGSSWAYGTGIDWAGQVVEKLTGQTLEEYMNDNIWNPLGIKSISFWPNRNPEMKARLAGMTARNPQDSKLVPYTSPLFGDAESGDCFGGHGAYADLQDYLKILHSILADDEILLKKETAALMFQPQLTKDSKAAQGKIMSNPEMSALFVGDFPTSIEYDWGIGGILIQQDNPGRRKKGTLIWSGLPNLFWFIDREAGLCGVYGTQVVPPGDPLVEETIKAFELGMYEKLNSAKL